MDCDQSSSIRVEPLSDAGGAWIAGVDLSAALSTAEITVIRDAFHEYGMIVIRGQDIDGGDQLRFC